ncbi:hypothetical protein V1506DRAFT_64592 [Lipomyces tetrasporus]
MTVQEYERVCSKEVKRGHLKLYRAPLAFDPSTVPADQQALAVDPYFLGVRLGDGKISFSATISSSDVEIAVWLQSYVDRLNILRQEDEPKLRLTKTLCSAFGTKMRSGYLANKDVFDYRIVGPLGGRYVGSPIWKCLRELGLVHDKSGGIPAAYMTADEDTRLA